MDNLSPLQVILKIIVIIINSIGVWLIFLTLKKKTKPKITFYFVIMVFLMFLWVNFAFFSRNLPTDIGLPFIRIAWAVTPFFFIMIFFFIKEFLDKKIRGFSYIKYLFIIIGMINIPVVFFSNVVIEDIYFEQDILKINYGIYSWLYFFQIILFTFLNFYILLRQYIVSKSTTEKRKIEHILIGFGFFFLMNSLFNIGAPVFFEIFHLYYLGDYSTIILIFLIAYTILKNELFGIKILLSHFLMFFIALVLFVIPFVIPKDLLYLRIITIILFLFFSFFSLYLLKVIKEEESRTRKLESLLKKEKQLRQKAELLTEEFEKLDDAKNQFIMATQHHLRTPLTAMMGYMDLLLSGTFGKIPPKINEVLLKFRSSNFKLNRTVNEFLDISQFQLGKEVVSFEPNVDVNTILSEMEKEIGFNAQNKGIYFKIKKTKIPLIKADKNKLKIVFFNVADNAIKYTNEGGVTVETKIINNKLQIIFKDTGMGLNSEDKKRLFTKLFERGSEAKKVFATGRGIGLYLSFKIVKAHKGDIWVTSEGPGKGSKFYIELPINN